VTTASSIHCAPSKNSDTRVARAYPSRLINHTHDWTASIDIMLPGRAAAAGNSHTESVDDGCPVYHIYTPSRQNPLVQNPLRSPIDKLEKKLVTYNFTNDYCYLHDSQSPVLVKYLTFSGLCRHFLQRH